MTSGPQRLALEPNSPVEGHGEVLDNYEHPAFAPTKSLCLEVR
jgi:hypothetical protein